MSIKIFIEENYEAMSRKAAEIIQAQVKAVPASVLGLATGGTPVSTYKELIKMHKAGELDFSRVTTFNLDEYFPIKKSDDQSYDYFMRENLFNHVNVPEGNRNIPNGEAADYNAECAAYDKKIIDKGGIDLQLLGIGVNGHIGFNEPADVFPSKTHYVALAEETIKVNARFFANEADVPRFAITTGIGTIMSAKKILLIASGANKAEILRDALFGGIAPKNPASALQLHPDVTIVADKEAGKLLG
jgi:glucosamine-6-phosphate deaminase